MEGAHISSSSDPENTFDTEKSKDKSKDSQESAIELRRRQHIAREALWHEEKPKKPPRLLIESKAESSTPDDSSETEAIKAEAKDFDESTMSDEELLYAAQILRRESKRQRHEVPPDPDTPPVIAAGDLLVDEWDDRIEDGENPDDALEAVLTEHDIPLDALAETVEAVTQEPLPETQAEYPQDFSDEVIITPHAASNEETTSEPAEADDVTGPEATNQLAAASSDRGTPPQPPAGTGGPGGRSPGGPHTPNGPPPIEATPSSSSGWHGNVTPAPSAASENAAPNRYEHYDQGNPVAAALLGGIIGYFIGRRRGRIKTEKKLLPIQKKLEKQVNDLNWELKAKEAKLRRVAAERVQAQGPSAVEAIVAESSHYEQEPNKPTTQTMSENGPVKILPVSDLAIERSYEPRRRAPEAKQLHGDQEAPEHIGHMLIAAEASPALRASKPGKEIRPASFDSSAGEQSTKTQLKENIKLPPNKRVETLPRAELLVLSEQINVEGSSLRQIYETHLIGERGLRRLVAEYLRGGDLKKAMQREIVEHEIDFERDPALRDLATTSDDPADNSVAQVAVPAHETLEQLLQKADADFTNSDDELAYHKARADFAEERSNHTRQQRRIVDIAMGTTIVVLVALVFALYFWHH